MWTYDTHISSRIDAPDTFIWKPIYKFDELEWKTEFPIIRVGCLINHIFVQTEILYCTKIKENLDQEKKFSEMIIV